MRIFRPALMIFLSLSFTLGTAADAKDLCESHYRAEGSPATGVTYSAYADFSQFDSITIMRRLRSQPKTGAKIRIKSIDDALGVITAKALNDEGTETFSLTFKVQNIDKGTRVTAALKMGAGEILGETDRERSAFMCQFVELASVEQPSNVMVQELALTNEEIVKLVDAGLDDDIIVAKIEKADAERLDVSTEALVALHKNKVSKRVIATMIKRSGGESSSAPKAQKRLQEAVNSPESSHGSSSAAELSDASVAAQYKACLEGLLMAQFPFNVVFSVERVAVKDRLVERTDASVVVDLTVRLKRYYGHDERLYFNSIVPPPADASRGNAGDLLTAEHTLKFKRFESGWRLVCGE
jgi:hypothetical protein